MGGEIQSLAPAGANDQNSPSRVKQVKSRKAILADGPGARQILAFLAENRAGTGGEDDGHGRPTKREVTHALETLKAGGRPRSPHRQDSLIAARQRVGSTGYASSKV